MYHSQSGRDPAGVGTSAQKGVLEELMRQQFLLNQRQQNFRWHQEHFLGGGGDPYHKPSEDDLFEMANLISLDPPNVMNPIQNNLPMMQLPSLSLSTTNVITPSNFMRGDQVEFMMNTTIAAFTALSPTPLGGGTVSTSRVEDDLFDDDELNTVLGEDHGPGEKHEAVRPSPKEQQQAPIVPMATPVINFLPETTLKEACKAKATTTTTTHHVRKRSCDRDDFDRSSRHSTTICGPLVDDADYRAADLEEEENETEWCLIDFGDDPEQSGNLSFESGRPMKRSRSFLDTPLDLFPDEEVTQWG